MVDLTNRFFEDMTHIDKINFILCFEEIVNIRCFCACHVLYFSFDQKNRSTTCDINFSFYLNALNPFWYVHPPPLTINVNGCLHQFLCIWEKKESFSRISVSKHLFSAQHTLHFFQAIKQAREKSFFGTKFCFLLQKMNSFVRINLKVLYS